MFDSIWRAEELNTCNEGKEFALTGPLNSLPVANNVYLIPWCSWSKKSYSICLEDYRVHRV